MSLIKPFSGIRPKKKFAKEVTSPNVSYIDNYKSNTTDRAVDNILKIYILSHMKDKIITIKPKGITQRQWSIFLLELNLMKKAWKSYGVDVQMSAPGLKKIIDWGTRRYGTESTE